jgi:hypothetical protein
MGESALMIPSLGQLGGTLYACEHALHAASRQYHVLRCVLVRIDAWDRAAHALGMRWVARLLAHLRPSGGPPRCFICGASLHPEDELAIVEGRRCHIECALRRLTGHGSTRPRRIA